MNQHTACCLSFSLAARSAASFALRSCCSVRQRREHKVSDSTARRRTQLSKRQDYLLWGLRQGNGSSLGPHEAAARTHTDIDSHSTRRSPSKCKHVRKKNKKQINQQVSAKRICHMPYLLSLGLLEFLLRLRELLPAESARARKSANILHICAGKTWSRVRAYRHGHCHNQDAVTLNSACRKRTLQQLRPLHSS